MTSLYQHPGGELTIIEPPSGWVSDFENPTRNPWTYALYWTMAVVNPLTLLFIGQKVYCKLRIRKTWQWDDTFLIIGYGCVVALTAIMIEGFAKKLLGVHAYELAFPGPFTEFRKTLYPMAVIYPVCALFGKLSLLISYLRLNNETYYRYLCFFGIFFIVGSNIGLSFAAAFPCQPIAMAWDSTITDGKCIDQASVYKATAIMGLLSDILLICIPIPMTLGLQMHWKQKAGLVALFFIGGITVFTSAMRLYFIITQLTELDQSWGAAPGAYFLVLEGHLALWCATVTTLRMFFNHAFPRLLGESASRSKKSDSRKEGGSRSHALVTFGSTPLNKSRKYNRFDTEYGLDTVMEPAGNNDIDIKGGNREGSDAEFARADDDSEKAIVQTRTTTVTYASNARTGG